MKSTLVILSSSESDKSIGDFVNKIKTHLFNPYLSLLDHRMIVWKLVHHGSPPSFNLLLTVEAGLVREQRDTTCRGVQSMLEVSYNLAGLRSKGTCESNILHLYLNDHILQKSISNVCSDINACGYTDLCELFDAIFFNSMKSLLSRTMNSHVDCGGKGEDVLSNFGSLTLVDGQNRQWMIVSGKEGSFIDHRAGSAERTKYKSDLSALDALKKPKRYHPKILSDPKNVLSLLPHVLFC